MRRLLPVLAAGLLLAACGSGTDDAGGSAPSTTARAVAPSDTGSSDTGSSDTGSSDTGSSDTGSSDTGSSDTGSSDTGSPSPVDSAPAGDSTPPATDGPAVSAPPDEGSAVVPAEAPEALQFSAPLIGGGDVELSTLAGRPVLLWFWAPW